MGKLMVTRRVDLGSLSLFTVKTEGKEGYYTNNKWMFMGTDEVAMKVFAARIAE